MLKVGDGADLLQKPLGAQHRGEFRAQHLERDLAVVAQVVGEVDGGHPAGADLALDPVPIRKRGGEFADDVDRSARMTGTANVTSIHRLHNAA